MKDETLAIPDEVFFALGGVEYVVNGKSNDKNIINKSFNLSPVNEERLKEISPILYDENYLKKLKKLIIKSTEAKQISQKIYKPKKLKNKLIGVKNFVKTISENGGIKHIISLVKNVIKSFGNVLVKSLKLVTKILSNSFKIIYKAFSTILKSLGRILKSSIKLIIKFIGKLAKLIFRAISSIIKSIIKIILKIFTRKSGKKNKFFPDEKDGLSYNQKQLSFSSPPEVQTNFSGNNKSTEKIRALTSINPAKNIKEVGSKRQSTIWKYFKRFFTKFFKLLKKVIKKIIWPIIKKFINIVVKTLVRFVASQIIGSFLPGLGNIIGLGVTAAFFVGNMMELYSFTKNMYSTIEELKADINRDDEDDEENDFMEDSKTVDDYLNNEGSEFEKSLIGKKIKEMDSIFLNESLKELELNNKVDTLEYNMMKAEQFQRMYDTAVSENNLEMINYMNSKFNIANGVIDAAHASQISRKEILEEMTKIQLKIHKTLEEESEKEVIPKKELDIILDNKYPNWLLTWGRFISYIKNKIVGRLNSQQYMDISNELSSKIKVRDLDWLHSIFSVKNFAEENSLKEYNIFKSEFIDSNNVSIITMFKQLSMAQLFTVHKVESMYEDNYVNLNKVGKNLVKTENKILDAYTEKEGILLKIKEAFEDKFITKYS